MAPLVDKYERMSRFRPPWMEEEGKKEGMGEKEGEKETGGEDGKERIRGSMIFFNARESGRYIDRFQVDGK